MSVWIEHPDLPGQVVEVSELSLPHHGAAGWVVTKAPEKPKKLDLDSEGDAATEDPSTDAAPTETTEAADGAAPSKTETESPRRRRASTKED